MKIILFTILTLSIFTAQAHIEKGSHAGKTAEGQACALEAGEQTFENNMPHPLNERISVKVGEDAFMIHHPTVIDVATATASFNHDLFEGVLALKTGAKALVVKMLHSEEFEGPSEFTFIENNWKTGEKKSLTCLGLKLVR